MEPAAGSLPVVAQPQPRPSWLALRAEDALEPDLPIVDPHHHFSEHWGGYFGPDLAADLAGGHHVTATVYVQCAHGYRDDLPPHLAPVGETETALRLARQAREHTAARVCAGIVGYADFSLAEEVDAVLEAHIVAGRGRFRGIRRSAARHEGFRYGMLAPPPWGLYADERFRRGFARLARHGLSFDALCFHNQLSEVTALARAFDHIPIVLNHCGAPVRVGPLEGQHAQVLEHWRTGMRELAACPNVRVKIGGFGMGTFGSRFHLDAVPPSSADLAEAWRPFVHDCLDFFGPVRCMFESNFPVDKGGCGYSVLWNAFKRLAAGLSASEKRAVFHDTAARFYRLDLSPSPRPHA